MWRSMAGDHHGVIGTSRSNSLCTQSNNCVRIACNVSRPTLSSGVSRERKTVIGGGKNLHRDSPVSTACERVFNCRRALPGWHVFVVCSIKQQHRAFDLPPRQSGSIAFNGAREPPIVVAGRRRIEVPAAAFESSDGSSLLRSRRFWRSQRWQDCPFNFVARLVGAVVGTGIRGNQHAAFGVR